MTIGLRTKILIMGALLSSVGFAQEIPFETEEKPPTPSEINTELEAMPAPTPPPPAPSTSGSAKTRPVPAELSGLGSLAPFSDIAVINKKYLPKTKRFEFFPNLGMVLNDSFFNNVIFGARLAYYFSEYYGVEAIGTAYSTTNKEVTDELSSERFISTSSLSTVTSYYGLDFKWSPIYGKLGWSNTKIIPFDFYFSAGGGVTKTNQNSSPTTLHLGAGQMFALSKWLAARWDISWFAYRSETSVANKPTDTFTNLNATIGLSIFFPSADYR